MLVLQLLITNKEQSLETRKCVSSEIRHFLGQSLTTIQIWRFQSRKRTVAMRRQGLQLHNELALQSVVFAKAKPEDMTAMMLALVRPSARMNMVDL